MKTTEGVKLNLSPATAYTLHNILTEWIAERTPVEGYINSRYRNHEPGFVEFKRAAITERITRLSAVIAQLED